MIEDLKASARNCSFNLSWIGKSRRTAKSICHAPKPLAKLRGASPRPESTRTKGVGINRPTSRTSLPRSEIPQPLKNRSAIGAVEIDRLARNKAQSRVIELPIRLQELVSDQSHGKSGSRGKAVIEAPVVQHGVRKSAMPHVRQIVRESSRKIVPDVEIAIASLVPEDEVLRTVVNTVRPRVGSQSRQSSAQSPPELNLQRVVVRRQAVLDEVIKSLMFGLLAGQNCIFLQQPRRMRTDIGDRESLRFAQCLLDAGVPLKRVRQLQMRVQSHTALD